MSSPTDNNARVAGEGSNRVYQSTEIVSAFLLGIAALASSWAGYQATRWSGVQASNYSQANALRIEASRVSGLANQRQAIDLGLYLNWLNAFADGHLTRQQYFRNSFRPEFVPAFDAWLAQQKSAEVPGQNTPFAMPEYKSSLSEKADQLEATAKEHFKIGENANEKSDAYVLDTVILSSVLFFAGIAPQFKIIQLRFGVLTVATLLCVFGLYKLATYPIA